MGSTEVERSNNVAAVGLILLLLLAAAAGGVAHRSRRSPTRDDPAIVSMGRRLRGVIGQCMLAIRTLEVIMRVRPKPTQPRMITIVHLRYLDRMGISA
mmetsp:Transcript_34333/g.60312  ORF Transcript_34333/g.60312 Transcript_34333/m.60312 type:complete len:98 (-) Transcript_34333:362-655(-)